jgi:hypothetical protein
MNYVPIEPRIVMARIANFHLALATLQLIHLLLFSESQGQDIVAWVFVNAIAQITLTALKSSMMNCKTYVELYWRPLAILLLITFLVKLYSRSPYILSWMITGLYETRKNENIGVGGLISYINIFFYPLSILLAFVKTPKLVYRWLMMCIIFMCCIDFMILGTRNAPLFVLAFHLFSYPHRLYRKNFIFLMGLVCVFVAIFSYTTVNRTQESQLGTFDWLVIFEFTGSTENLKINTNISKMLNENAPIFFPVIFLTHYVTHSIAEIALLVSNSADLSIGGGYYLTDQFCAVGICDRITSLAEIENVNPRAGIYQTVWGSLIFDFGLIGAITVWVLLILVMIIWQIYTGARLSPFTVLVAILVALSPIENYLYNGLGLVQIIMMFVVYGVIKILGSKFIN